MFRLKNIGCLCLFIALINFPSVAGSGSPNDRENEWPILPALSFEDGKVQIDRLQGEIIFDGMPDESAWQQTSSFPFVTHSPVPGLPVTEKTEVRMLFGNNYLYIGARLLDRSPDKIQAASRQRDEAGMENDWMGVVFDTYNDNQSGIAFFTNPEGLRTDFAIFDDAKQSSGTTFPVNFSWNTHWDVKTVVNEEGWFAEMQIPVSSLRFQEVNGKVEMGVILMRFIPHLNEHYIYPAIPNEFGDFSHLKVSRAQDVVFQDLKSKKPLYITPYALAGIGQYNELNDAETAYEYTRENKLNAGLDLKYGITSNLALDVTLNTDFAQVESDDEQVNLTRFSLFYEEKRQFFLERASIFDFNTGGPTTMFYSRRIGLDEDFNIVPIIGGVRLIGRKNNLDVGFLNMQTAVSDSLPSENFSVLRMKKGVINENSYVGGIWTSRIGMDGSYNQAYGVDALIRVNDHDYLGIVWGQTFETGVNASFADMRNYRYRLNLERRRNIGFRYDIIVSGTGEDYNPGIGFQHRHDYHTWINRFDYTWQASPASIILQHGPGIEQRNFLSASKGIIETVTVEPYYRMNFKSLWGMRGGVSYNYDVVFEEFDLSDSVYVPVGSYEYNQAELILNTPGSRNAWVFFTGQAGQYYDGKFLSLNFLPSWSISSGLTLSGAYIYSNVIFPERDQHFISHIARLKALVMFSTKLSLSAFIQYNSADHLFLSNVRFRYNPREGNDFYIVYNEGANSNLKREVPHLPGLAARTIMLKYTYTFRL